MSFYTDDQPIIACSTGLNSNTAIAVIRLSGFKAISELQPFFSFPLSKIKSRYSHLTNIIFNERVFDNGLMVFFPKENSYTGENVLELSVHGNLINIQNILDLFVRNGNFRSAHPGEFTYRALKNKKLSLSQVEGLDMLLNANSNLMLSQGLDVLQGQLYEQYVGLYESFLKLKAAVEISIDFSEDVGEEESNKLFRETFRIFKDKLDALHTRTQGSVSSLLAPEVVLVGQTNAGKSSLFNLLVKHNRSIVSNIAGTTRDYISEVISIDGTNFNLVDTAGIRESGDLIENLGIERAFEILDRAFVKILIINPFETNPDYLNKLSPFKFDILLFSHSDQSDFLVKISELDLTKISVSLVGSASFVSGSIGPMDLSSLKFGPIEPAPISFSQVGPIEPLVKKFLESKFAREASNNPILIERHRSVINNLYLKAESLSNNINKIDDVAIISSEVNIFSHYLSELIGVVSPDDVLNSIFANFCIGK